MPGTGGGVRNGPKKEGIRFFGAGVVSLDGSVVIEASHLWALCNQAAETG